MPWEDINAWVSQAGPWLVPLVMAAAFAEHVFPPFPGDTVVLVGAWLAARGDVPWWGVFVGATSGSVLGAGLNYAFGVWLQRRLSDPARRRGREWVSPQTLERLEAQYRRWGVWLILANRFVPVSRAFFFVFAGMSALGLARTMLLGAVSALAWNALLITVGHAVGANLDELKAFFNDLNRAMAVGTAVVLAAGAFYVWRRRRQKPAAEK